ncbi:MAG: dockerin type I domain-containing protein [Oscillospiraceae bacterium]|jgi:hypothetical protein|nr:dockerin type I domain-containing protein [Oscillospiraceae bacterium]
MSKLTAGMVSLTAANHETKTFTTTANMWSADGKTVTVPYSDLDGSTEYTVNISGFSDADGNVMVLDSNNKFTTEYVEPAAVLYGYINDDDIIDIIDVTMVYQYYRQKITLTDAQFRAANVDGDGGITIADVELIYQFYRHKISKFPVETSS